MNYRTLRIDGTLVGRRVFARILDERREATVVDVGSDLLRVRYLDRDGRTSLAWVLRDDVHERPAPGASVVVLPLPLYIAPRDEQ